jgi:hypothetical protein
MIGGNAQQFQERVDGIKRYPTQQHSSGDPNINRSSTALKYGFETVSWNRYYF